MTLRQIVFGLLSVIVSIFTLAIIFGGDPDEI